MTGNPKDLAAGLLFIGFGCIAVVVGLDYPAGAAARMGPGYFPRILGGLLVALGAAVAMRAVRVNGAPPALAAFGPVAVVLLAVVSFAVTAPHLGLVVSAFLVVAIASRASREFRPGEVLLSSTVLAAASALVFVYGLGLQLAPWPAALVGP